MKEHEEDCGIYMGFAPLYDEYMDNIAYDEWHEYIRGILSDRGIRGGTVAELACGTGVMTAMLAADGYDMIGVDVSCEMLEIARERCGDGVLLIEQDMRELELYGSVRAFVCVCDGMNYLLDEKDLRKVFCRVNKFLDCGGVFIFDMKTRHFYEDVLGNATIAENRETSSLIWENEFDPDKGINEYLITAYRLCDERRGLYERIEEVHRQRAYSIDKVAGAIEGAGLRAANIYGAFTKEAPDGDSERVFFVAEKTERAIRKSGAGQ